MKGLTKIAMGASFVSLMMLTACGTAGQTSGGNTSGSSASGGKILIGVITPVTGQSAKMGQDMNNGIKMAAEEINKKGGVLGKQIQIDYEDGAADPQTATAAANKLASENVAAVVGGYASGACLPATGVLHQAGIPWVITAADSAKIPAEGYSNIFLLNSTAGAQADTATKYMMNTLHGKKIAIIDDNSAYSVDLAKLTQTDVQKAGGQVIAFDAVNPQETDFTSELTKLKGLNPDVTYWTGYYSAGGLLLKQFKQLGVSGAFGVGDGSNDPTLVKIAGSQNAEGYFTTTTPTPQFQASAKDWSQQYKAEFGEDPGPYSALSYDGLRVIANAIATAKSDKSADITKALAATNGFQTFGGPLSFKPTGEPTNSNYIVLLYKNGQYEVAK